MFEEYYEDADLYININKKTGRKYQLFFMYGEYRNEKNRKIRIDRFIEKTLNKGAREYYKTKTIYKQLSNGLGIVDFYGWWYEVSVHKKTRRSVYPLVNNSDKVSLFNEKGKQIIDFWITNKKAIIYVINKRRFIIHEPENLKVVDKKGLILSETSLYSPDRRLCSIRILDSNHFILGSLKDSFSLFNIKSSKFEIQNQEYLFNAFILRKGKQKPEPAKLLTNRFRSLYISTESLYIYSLKTKELIKEEDVDCIGDRPNPLLSFHCKNLGKNLISYEACDGSIVIFDKKSRNFINQRNDGDLMENYDRSFGVIKTDNENQLVVKFPRVKSEFNYNKKTGKYTITNI